MAKVEGWQHSLLWILIILVIAGVVIAGIFYFFRDILPGMRPLIDFGFAIFFTFCVGFIALVIICPDTKRGQLSNRITVVVALLAYSSCIIPALFKYVVVPVGQFNGKLFLIEGVLVGAIIMGIIYAIAQVIHWAIKGKLM
jgi:hypothetical protein